MGFRRRTRRRALIAGAAIAHHEDRKYAQASEQEPEYEQAPAPAPQPQYAPPAPDPADEIEHYAKLHEEGALTDDEFAAAKARILGQ
jgi:transposase